MKAYGRCLSIRAVILDLERGVKVRATTRVDVYSFFDVTSYVLLSHTDLTRKTYRYLKEFR